MSSLIELSIDLPPIAVKTEEADAFDAEGNRDELEAESVGSAEGDAGALEQDELEPPAAKRIRTGKTNPTFGKRARGKQGRLEGLMKMPVDIFTQIAYLLNPADLISLIRSNQFFRGLLLRRSAVLIWRKAESNVPELPACPPGICEPQYAALLFSKHCTLCGASATAKPDTHLFARLCRSCCDSKLVEVRRTSSHKAADSSLVNCSSLINVNLSKTRPRAYDQLFGLKSEVKYVNGMYQRFQTAKDSKGWAAWVAARRKTVSDRHKHAFRISSYLHSAEKSRGKELREVKGERQDMIVRRLKDLGWTNRDMMFHNDDVKPWRALVSAAKPLTERIWNNILPKLTTLLEENRARHLEYDRVVGRIDRRKCVDKFLTKMKYSEYLLEPIIKALGAQPPTSEASFHLSASEDSVDVALGNPFPHTVTALDWDCLADLSGREITTEEVQAELDARRDQVRLKVLEWRAGMEQQLVEQYQDVAEDGYQNTVVTVKGSTELTAHLSPGLRLLLRADTIFKKCDESQGDSKGRRVSELSRASYHYPRLVYRLWESFDENIWFPPEPIIDVNAELGLYQRHLEMEKVVKALLRSLGMPDVARVELVLMRARFVCGRCTDNKPKRWDQIIYHYVQELKRWNKEKDSKPIFPIRYPITYRNVHDFSSQDNPKPLVQLVTEQEAQRLLHLPTGSSIPWRACLMCDTTARGVSRLHPDVMSVHMQDVHNVSAPVEKVHYGFDERTDILSDKWHKRWNAFHDAQAPGLSL